MGIPCIPIYRLGTWTWKEQMLPVTQVGEVNLDPNLVDFNACGLSTPGHAGEYLRIKQLSLTVIIVPSDNLLSPLQISQGSLPQLSLPVFPSNAGLIPFALYLPTHLRLMNPQSSQGEWGSHPLALASSVLERLLCPQLLE